MVLNFIAIATFSSTPHWKYMDALSKLATIGPQLVQDYDL